MICASRARALPGSSVAHVGTCLQCVWPRRQNDRLESQSTGVLMCFSRKVMFSLVLTEREICQGRRDS